MKSYSLKKFGFDKNLPYKKRKNEAPLDFVPKKVWLIKMKESNALIEVFPVHNALIFNSEISAQRYFNSDNMKDRHGYEIIKVLVTTEKYIKNRVQKAIRNKKHEK